MFDVFYEIGQIIGVILGNALLFMILLGIIWIVVFWITKKKIMITTVMMKNEPDRRAKAGA